MKKPTILIAEGKERLCQQLKACLLQHGFETIEVSEKPHVLNIFSLFKCTISMSGKPCEGVEPPQGS